MNIQYLVKRRYEADGKDLETALEALVEAARDAGVDPLVVDAVAEFSPKRLVWGRDVRAHNERVQAEAARAARRARWAGYRKCVPENLLGAYEVALAEEGDTLVAKASTIGTSLPDDVVYGPELVAAAAQRLALSYACGAKIERASEIAGYVFVPRRFLSNSHALSFVTQRILLGLTDPERPAENYHADRLERATHDHARAWIDYAWEGKCVTWSIPALDDRSIGGAIARYAAAHPEDFPERLLTREPVDGFPFDAPACDFPLPVEVYAATLVPPTHED